MRIDCISDLKEIYHIHIAKEDGGNPIRDGMPIAAHILYFNPEKNDMNGEEVLLRLDDKKTITQLLDKKYDMALELLDAYFLKHHGKKKYDVSDSHSVLEYKYLIKNMLAPANNIVSQQDENTGQQTCVRINFTTHNIPIKAEVLTFYPEEEVVASLNITSFQRNAIRTWVKLEFNQKLGVVSEHKVTNIIASYLLHKYHIEASIVRFAHPKALQNLASTTQASVAKILPALKKEDLDENQKIPEDGKENVVSKAKAETISTTTTSYNFTRDKKIEAGEAAYVNSPRKALQDKNGAAREKEAESINKAKRIKKTEDVQKSSNPVDVNTHQKAHSTGQDHEAPLHARPEIVTLGEYLERNIGNENGIDVNTPLNPQPDVPAGGEYVEQDSGCLG